MRLLLCIILLFAFFSCSNQDKVPKDITQPDVMKSVLLDMQAATAYVNNMPLKMDSVMPKEKRFKEYYKEILEIHHLSKDQFLKSYHYYETHPDHLRTIYDSMQSDIKKFRAINDSLLRKKHSIEAPE